MKLKLGNYQGSDYKTTLIPDLTSLSGPLEIDISDVNFFRPSTLTILYALFANHHHLYPNEKRICVPPSKESDVYRYMQRINFFKSCPDLKEFADEDFFRHSSSGTFIPITQLKSDTDSHPYISEIIRIIFPNKQSDPGVGDIQYSFSELVGNSMEHSKSPVGCIIQAQLYKERYLYGVILDVGVGIKRHLKGNQAIASQITSDEIAIEFALKPNISGTHNRKRTDMERTELETSFHHAGLGLTICSQLMVRSGGYIHIVSGQAGHLINKDGVAKDKIGGWPGTAIFFNIDCENIPSASSILEDVERRKSDPTEEGLEIEN